MRLRSVAGPAPTRRPVRRRAGRRARHRLGNEKGAEGMSKARKRPAPLALLAAALAIVSLGAVGCGGSGGGGGAKTLRVAIVNNPQMEDIAKLTPSLFTKDTGIKVKYTVPTEATLREIVTRDVSAGGKQFDIVMIGPYEAPQFGTNGWLK